MKALISFLKIHLLGTLAGVVIWFLYKTIRWEWCCLSSDGERVFEPPAKILAFWHGRQLMIPAVYWGYRSKSKPRACALISIHSDGRLIAKAISVLGIDSVAGSSSRKGSEASIALIDKIRHNSIIAITPDGPRGPIHEAKPGVLKISAVTNSEIFPLSFSANRYWQFRSWDRMILPKPFSKAVFVVGKPMLVTEALNDENVPKLTKELNEQLNAVETKADSYFHD